jgi:hypothetical protein
MLQGRKPKNAKKKLQQLQSNEKYKDKNHVNYGETVLRGYT